MLFRSAVAALRADGVAVSLLSGDAPERAARLAQRLGIDEVEGGATPEAKLAVLARAQEQGRAVAMVGDGVNDGPVLARADVSIAMGQGALVARAQADAVVLVTDRSRSLDALDVFTFQATVVEAAGSRAVTGQLSARPDCGGFDVLGLRCVKKVVLHEPLTNIRKVVTLIIEKGSPRVEIWRALYGAAYFKGDCSKICIAGCIDL